MVPSDCRMFIWNYLLCMLFLWMEQGGIFCTFPSPSISKSPFFILYIDIWRTVSTVPSYPHLFSLSNLPPHPNIFLLFCRYWSACVDALNISPTPSIFCHLSEEVSGRESNKFSFSPTIPSLSPIPYISIKLPPSSQ